MKQKKIKQCSRKTPGLCTPNSAGLNKGEQHWAIGTKLMLSLVKTMQGSLLIFLEDP